MPEEELSLNTHCYNNKAPGPTIKPFFSFNFLYINQSRHSMFVNQYLASYFLPYKEHTILRNVHHVWILLLMLWVCRDTCSLVLRSWCYACNVWTIYLLFIKQLYTVYISWGILYRKQLQIFTFLVYLYPTQPIVMSGMCIYTIDTICMLSKAGTYSYFTNHACHCV